MRPVAVWSTALTVFRQAKAPKRSGVSKLKAVARVPAVCATVSTVPSGRAMRSGGSGVLSLRLVTRLRAGDQVTFRPRSRGRGVSVMAGSWVVELLSVRFWRRLPPIASVPQPNRREKLTELVICWVLRSGSSEFWLTIVVLLR